MADKSEDEDVLEEPEFMDIITTQRGTIAGKGLVQEGSKHVIHKSAFSKQWMIPDAKTADGIMEIDPSHRYSVNLSTMAPEELKVLMAKLDIKTQKKKMKRADVERLIRSRLIEIAEDEAEE